MHTRRIPVHRGRGRGRLWEMGDEEEEMLGSIALNMAGFIGLYAGDRPLGGERPRKADYFEIATSCYDVGEKGRTTSASHTRGRLPCTNPSTSLFGLPTLSARWRLFSLAGDGGGKFA